MNCPNCVSTSCREIECPSYLRALVIGGWVVRAVLVASAALVLIGAAYNVFDRATSKPSVMGVFWERQK